jgi:hypothetical protein
MKVLLLFFLFPVALCNFTKHNVVVLSIVNKGEKNIDSVKIRGYMAEERFINLYPDSVQKRNILVEPPDNREGGFTIIVFQKDSVVYVGQFGYYINADNIQDNYKLSIAADYTAKEVR